MPDEYDSTNQSYKPHQPLDDGGVEGVDSFIAGLTQRVDRIIEAARNRDFHLLCTLAHRLKGSAGGCGYPIITQKAAVLEHHASLSELESVIEDLQELKHAVERVVTPV